MSQSDGDGSSAAEQDAGSTPGFWPRGDAGAILEQREFVVPVLGSGISVPAGLPGAEDLAKWIVDNVEPATAYSNESALFTVAGEIGVEEASLCENVADWLAQFEPQPTAVSEALVRLSSRFIVTLNYDLLIEESATRAGIPCESLISDEEGLERAVELIVDINRWPPEKLVVLHLHGSLEEPESIVLGPRGYQRLCSRTHFSDLVMLLMRQKAMVFLGTTLDELQLLAEMRKHRGAQRHVMLCPEDEKSALTEARAAISRPRDGILIETFGDYAELDGFAAKLAISSPIRVPTEPVIAAPANRPASFKYIPNVLLQHSSTRTDESDQLAAAILGRAYGSKPFGELDVAFGQRTLIIGAPGSGKSELLREVGGLVPASEQAVLIRCAELEAASGDALSVLANCASRGTGLNGEFAVSIEALKQRRFHFLFDGLDERLVGDQERLARLIVQLARAFPQHRFTVATRPVAAVSVFPREEPDGETPGEWRVLELAPDRSWQTSYLAAADVTLEELEAQMPALRDLSELLQLPFFLSRTVELYRAGRLRALRDLFEVVQDLVTLALERETEIRLPQEAVRGWLRELALAMHLAGRTSLRLDELAELPLPGPVEELIGSTEEVADTLISRLLLLERGGEYSFTHRIVGEALVAEALNEMAPESEVLDAVVPASAEGISSVRRDWAVPMTFLMGRNEAWRTAVAERDALAAARSVPASALAEERGEAARTIWETYLQLGIWMWKFETPELLNDAAALARLLAAGDQEEMVGTIRQAVEDESPEVQGNAIRVLSFADPDGFAEDLARVLNDDGRKSVVRRHAAIAARQINAHELLPLIVHRAAVAGDSVEGQDFAISAFDMARDSEIVDTAIQLAGSRYARMMAEPRLRKLASGAEQVRFLRAYAEHAQEPYGLETSLLEEALSKVNSDAEASTIRDAAFVATMWDVQGEAVRDLIERDRGAALEGLLQAIEREGMRMFSLEPYLDLFSLDALEAAGVPEAVLTRKKLLSEAAAAPAPVDRPRRPSRMNRVGDARRSSQAPTLSELLSRDREEWDETIAHHAQRLASQVAELSAEEADDLRSRLDDWWPEKSYAETITRTSPNAWRQENRAAAWLWFGPALDKGMNQEQWGELAACGILFEDQLEWLRRHADEASKQALARVCTATDSYTWERALAATPDPLPPELVSGLVTHLSRSNDAYSLGYVGQRLRSSVGSAPIQRLSERSEEFAVTLRPLLAADGDMEAQRILVRELRRQLEEGKRPEGRGLAWLNDVTEDALLDDLFVCLELLYGPSSQLTDTQAWFTNDVITPVMSAIRHIGGAPAVQRYDKLIARGEGFQFLHSQRETVAQSILEKQGMEAAGQAASLLGIPAFQPASD